MKEEILRTLMKIEITTLMKKGVSREDAIEQAADKLSKDMKQAEYVTYCNEHDI